MKIERHHQKEQDPKVRAKNFTEPVYNFDPETAIAEAKRCLKCKNAPCVNGCPVAVKIPEFIGKLAGGDPLGAAAVIRETNNLPAVCGRVCPQEEQCEKLCIRARMEGPVSIGALERYAADYALEHGPEQTPPKGSLKGRVAVVGSGPSSLTCAADCAAAGLSVTVYEAFHLAGGVLVYGIPEFRLPKSLVQKEIGKLLSLGVQLELNTVIGKTITLPQLLEKFDAVFIGSGAGLPQFLNIPGESLNGVYSANEYLTRVNLMRAYDPDSPTPVARGGRVTVFGAGNVAMDAARTALRLGADRVSIVYRRGREEMPARKEEIRHAEEEGIVFELLTAPLEIVGENGRVRAVKCVRCELGAPDASGRRRPVVIPDSDFEIPCETAIVAVGTSPNPLIKDSAPDLKVTEKGTIIVDEKGATSIPGVYAGGDAVTGAATVILAMGAGRTAAASIIEYSKTDKKQT
ncbi:glutamate synthase (NADPH), homotetrameric [Clostridia bacterium]|nr:glutamate synthase (NADPH), homotetrameric [Clostridia bacterium]